ncbi:MAG: hypothetical protein RSH78_01295 [Bacilli bacterium]|uniref:hypothetical protein n=1 Tax=Clostridium sp. TaxID=1506 RepID=UPI002FCB7280
MEQQRYIECDECGYEIYLEDDRYLGDTYYEIDEENICEECILTYIKRFRKQG